MYVVYAGDGPLRSELEDLAAELGMAERVRFLGFENQSGLPAVYRAADVLVLPSAYEPFGLVVNEAFATGIPAIVSAACGSAGDLVREGSTGFVVEVGEVDDLADRLHRLAADPELRAAMGERAQARLKDWGPAQNASAFADACLALAVRARVN
jgi:glycosyltransferase involved in cell wall biosynthesis